VKKLLLQTETSVRQYFAVNLLFLFIVGLSSCDDLIEPDISGEQVVLLSPDDKTHSTISAQVLRWSTVAHARSYRVQLVRPTFTGVHQQVLDTLVKQPSLTKSLAPGNYEWRVQAQNAGYSTGFTTQTFTIDSTSNLNGQTLLLQRPASGLATNATSLTFTWGRLAMAQQYRLSITPNPRGASLAALDTVVGNSTSVSLRLARQSQTYQWKVTALNATGQAVSASQAFEVDLTPPPAPTLVAPVATASFLAQPISLSWTRTATDVAVDSVSIYQANQTSLFTGFPRLSSGTALTLSGSSTPLQSGTYYWSVRSIDKAGNLGPATVKRSFILQ